MTDTPIAKISAREWKVTMPEDFSKMTGLVRVWRFKRKTDAQDFYVQAFENYLAAKKEKA